MKKSILVATVLLIVMALAPAASATPGNGTGWTTEYAECDQGSIQITGHEGLWSATHLDGNRRMILTKQLVTLNTGTERITLFELPHPGHRQQQPNLTNCYFSFETPDGLVEITLDGFSRP